MKFAFAFVLVLASLSGAAMSGPSGPMISPRWYTPIQPEVRQILLAPRFWYPVMPEFNGVQVA